ncbi:MAG: DUF1003 domain-containing protein [Candidatus Pacearchaeota archaeon]
MEKEGMHPVNRIKKKFHQKAADMVSQFAGSWIFIFIIITIITSWILINEISKNINFDPKPYIMLNLLLNIVTLILSPIILMSQNRESQRDRLRAEYDYALNKKSEKEIRELKEDIKEIKKILKKDK